MMRMKKRKQEEAISQKKTSLEESVVKEKPETTQPKDIKLGEIQLKETSVLVIKKTNYMDKDRIDFRVWMNSSSYKGPTKQGFTLPMDKIDEFVNIVEGMKKKLEEQE
jgi:hypothetical protein